MVPKPPADRVPAQIASAEPAAGDGETVISAEAWAAIGHMLSGSETTDGNWLVHSVRPECRLQLDDASAPQAGAISDFGKLTEAESDMLGDQIRVVTLSPPPPPTSGLHSSIIEAWAAFLQ